MPTYFISCDWGTSSFRLRLAEALTCKVLQEITSSQGIAATHQAFIKETAGKEYSHQERLRYYLQYLTAQIHDLEKQVSFSLKGIPVIVSGMASSSIGMLELPYTSLPYLLNGSGATTEVFAHHTDFPHDLLLISGLRSAQDVMRGEETQVTGLATMMPLDQAICIFPGTHSKHIYVNNGSITGFRTYMTGELFQTLATHTILQASVDKSTVEADKPKLLKAFRQGVQAGKDLENILHALFTVRTGELFKERNKQESYYYLSGLLIGKELQDLYAHPQTQVYLCSSSHLLDFYVAAAEVLVLPASVSIVPASLIDTIVVAGQWQIWQMAQGNKLLHFS
jgi:2-dehydro-3-deoxygalactonokinase